MELEKRAIENIELDKVLSIIKSYSLSKEGRELINPDAITADVNLIARRYETIDTYINYLEGSEPLNAFPNLDPLFDEAIKSHRDIDGMNIRNAGEYLDSYFLAMRFLRCEEDIKKEDIELRDEILFALDNTGSVREDHPRLLPLIKERDAIRHKRLTFSESYIAKNRASVQNANPLYKNERVVIPIKADNRPDDKFYVSGASASGATIFSEPFELVELNNNVVLADERIREEKLRIVHELSEKVRGEMKFLGRLRKFIAEFDYHYSFAVWAKKNKARHPQIADSINLIKARHPLLGPKAVPIDIRLDKREKVLVLSGANAGGKTVTMKTIALCHMLYQMSGFCLADELSTLVIFSSFYCDIGDGQSIEDSASTFSSHMSNIAHILKCADKGSLILLDELGSGTDPEEGAALSISILSHLADKARLTLTTSHYQALKNYAYTSSNMANASMTFDEKSGYPTYRVLQGIPGESYAISAAKRAGMDKSIIENAEELLGKERETSSKIITALLSKSRTLDKKITEAEIIRKRAEKREEEAEKREEELKAKIFSLEKKGYSEIDDYLKDKRREVERLIRDIKTGKLTKETNQKIHQSLDAIDKRKSEIKSSIKEKELLSEEDNLTFSPGENVMCSSSKTPGKILEDRGRGRYYVELSNGLRMELKASMLYKDKAETKAEVMHYGASRKASYEMDIRGYSVEEAERALDDQLESAILSNLTSFSIIHGYGDGILSRFVHSYLKKRKEVKDYRFALPEDGGMGKTYVTLSF